MALKNKTADQALSNKAKETGIPKRYLEQVYRRGAQAWTVGHRAGATQQQWALARVNSFATKGKGTWGGNDADIAKKVREAKRKK